MQLKIKDGKTELDLLHTIPVDIQISEDHAHLVILDMIGALLCVIGALLCVIGALLGVIGALSGEIGALNHFLKEDVGILPIEVLGVLHDWLKGDLGILPIEHGALLDLLKEDMVIHLTLVEIMLVREYKGTLLAIMIHIQIDMGITQWTPVGTFHYHLTILSQILSKEQ